MVQRFVQVIDPAERQEQHQTLVGNGDDVAHTVRAT